MSDRGEQTSAGRPAHRVSRCRRLVLVAFVLGACGTDSDGFVPPPATAALDRIAWFYKPPAEGQACDVAAHDLVILTHGDEGYRDAEGLSDALMYVLPFALEHPGPNERPRRNQLVESADEFDVLLDEHPDWFLRDRSGAVVTERIVDPVDEGRVLHYADPGSAGYREWFLERLAARVRDNRWRGAFLDNVDMTLGRFRALGIALEAYSSDGSWFESVEQFVEDLSLAADHPVWANLTFADDALDHVSRIRVHLDGDMDEAFALGYLSDTWSVDDWERSLERLERGLGARGVLAVIQGRAGDDERRRFGYASFLLAAGDGAFVRYTDASAYDRCDPVLEYDLDLGVPLGPRRADGSIWVREFENGSVVVDPERRTAEIRVGDP